MGTSRKYVILIIFMSVGVVFIARLLYMQVLDKTWSERAQELTQKAENIHAPRGIIYDRNGEKLVDNKTYYDLRFVPDKIGDIDTLAFCELIGMTKGEFLDKIEWASTYPRASYAPSDLLTQISQDDFETLSERLYEYGDGFFEVAHALRSYPRSIAPHLVGYLNEVSPEDMAKDEYYLMGDYIGRTGIEKAYEKELRGIRGLKYHIKDANEVSTDQEIYNESNRDPVNGESLVCTIDSDLQEYGEKLMSNKIGSIVAIEPSTGEILAMVSAPTYDPNWMVGRKNRNQYFPIINTDSLAPTRNRAIFAAYPPGSIFKMFQALIGMKLGYLTSETVITCTGGIIGDHVPAGSYSMFSAIKSSSNEWFWRATRRIIQPGQFRSHFKDSQVGLAAWSKEVRSMGIGVEWPSELEGVNKGNVPDTAYYNELYGKGSWAFSTIASLSIGQGEMLLTPLQMANLGAILANRGYYYYPHLIRQIGDESKRAVFREKHVVFPDTSIFPVVIDAMRGVVEDPGGTARLARTKGIRICGKTGTAENPHGEDHSVFLAFAPMHNPKIAVAVYVENATWGGAWAAPIASLMIEQYLKGHIEEEAKEKRILEADFINGNPNDPNQH